SVRARARQLEADLDIEGKRARLADLQERAGTPGLWDDPDAARMVTTELSRVESDVSRADALRTRIDDLEVLDELAQEEDDADAAGEVDAALREIVAELDRLEVATMLSGEYDDS